ncbi:hypothetical protein CRENBAI_014087 [Crenichthys baileyi]|uniref:Uncharacterized protein n=1 Tax=Crenichthys baileyi TaxID=28760 RepID=A0AAV9R821_9TELE
MTAQGSNTNQVSSTITAQTIQTPVTPQPKIGHNPPTSHTATPPSHPPTRSTTPEPTAQSQQSTRSLMPHSPAMDPSHKQASGATKHTPHHHRNGQQMNQNRQRQQGSQANPPKHHPTHHHAQRKDAAQANRMPPLKCHSLHCRDDAHPTRDEEPPTSRPAKPKKYSQAGAPPEPMPQQ